MAATQCRTCRHGQDDLMKFKPSIGLGKNDDISNFECGMVDDAEQAGLGISEIADLLRFSHKTHKE